MFQTRDIPQLRENTYELAYNSACQLVGRGQFTDAEKKLKVSEKLCRESLEDDGTGEDDVEDELRIIKYVTMMIKSEFVMQLSRTLQSYVLYWP